MIQTQVLENYGTEFRPSWKAKGGDDYVVPNFTQFNDIHAVIDSIRQQIETDNSFYQEYIVDWYVAEDNELTKWEQQQLDLDGRIIYPAKELVALV
jgi:hypothetical protein